jgi:hypothetical protein
MHKSVILGETASSNVDKHAAHCVSTVCKTKHQPTGHTRIPGMSAGVVTSLLRNSVRFALKIESSPMPQMRLCESSIVSSSVLPDLKREAVV